MNLAFVHSDWQWVRSPLFFFFFLHIHNIPKLTLWAPSYRDIIIQTYTFTYLVTFTTYITKKTQQRNNKEVCIIYVYTVFLVSSSCLYILISKSHPKMYVFKGPVHQNYITLLLFCVLWSRRQFWFYLLEFWNFVSEISVFLWALFKKNKKTCYFVIWVNQPFNVIILNTVLFCYITILLSLAVCRPALCVPCFKWTSMHLCIHHFPVGVMRVWLHSVLHWILSMGKSCSSMLRNKLWHHVRRDIRAQSATQSPP